MAGIKRDGGGHVKTGDLSENEENIGSIIGEDYHSQMSCVLQNLD